jgi:beta-N-acetylhexosaminidase
MLNGDRNSTQLETDLRRAHWIVFAMLNVTSDIPSSQALRRFLSERPDLVQQKRLVVFAFNSPYYLEATNISKIMAYYGLYSKSPRFIDVAARLLFREMRPTGALPVSVPGIGYDLITATSPDPNQVIPLLMDVPGNEVQKTATVTAEPTPAPEFHVGNTIAVRTGVIIDHNGHRVPDGTPVQFIISVGSEVMGLPQTVNTVDGVARTTIQVTSPGALEIRAESEPARQSQTLHFDIPTENGIPFTDTPTVTPTETPTVTPSPTTPPPVIDSTEPPPPERPTLVDWLMALLVAAAIGFSVYRLAALIGQVRWGVRSGFLALIGGLLAYSYLALKMPGSEALLQTSGAWGVILVTLLGCVSGILVTWGWRAIQTGTELTN